MNEILTDKRLTIYSFYTDGNMNRSWIIYIVLTILGASGFTGMINSIPSPEKRIIGSWKEKSWEYEKVESKAQLADLKSSLTDEVKMQLGKHLKIHTAESWYFYPNGILVLEGDDTKQECSWSLKGRGHILQLKYSDGIVESYNLTDLDQTRMVLNFTSEMDVRGLAKLTFEKY